MEVDPVVKLPVDEFREKIEKSIEDNIVTIITAETGAGKSTRVPMWLWKKGKRVHVTQPRRIATRSLSYYLAKTENKTWGEEIGYLTGFEKKSSKRTELLYLTDGVQMVREVKGQVDYDVLILDEIHEWNLNQEVLTGIVKKKILNGYFEKSGKRVVVMSATLQAERLSKFFEVAQVIKVPGRGFPVTMHNNSSWFLLSDTVQMVEAGKNVLVFLPGKGEIGDFISTLKESLEEDKLKAVILPLHSELTVKEQSQVFLHYKYPKVIVSTDIAQTSLTIDDVDAVIDSGIKKEIHNIKGIEGLYPINISKSECVQRAGRAGRVKNGQYFMCSDIDMDSREQFPEPEIRRLNLESVVLRLIKWGVSPLEFPYFHSPKKNLIYKAIEKLKIFGAVSDDGNITEDGKKMAELPVSLRASRLLIEIKNGSDAALDMGLKVIAIFEAKGITGRDYAGEKLYSDFYGSDLLSQFFLWNSQGKNKNIISFKKLSLAKEIYRELRKRLFLTKQPIRSKDISKDVRILFRAVLSSFVDHVYKKSGDGYFREDEERQLDRNSILYISKPEMAAGLPFDLVLERENRFTGEREKFNLPLLTFVTEISLKILDEFGPFSYRKDEEIKIEKNVISFNYKVFFGGELLSRFSEAPVLSSESVRKKVATAVVRWWKENCKDYELNEKKEKLIKYFNEIRDIAGTDLKPFDFYWESYLIKKISEDLNTEDLGLFFKFHKDFVWLSLNELLPGPVISSLKQKRWPQKINIGEKNKKIEYIKGRPFLKFDLPEFEDVKRGDILLPTGEECCFFLDKRNYTEWVHAVYSFNRWKKIEIFRRKWKMEKKEGNMDDLTEVPFPVKFEGGTGKENEKFYFYSVPEIEGDKVYLKHFFEKDKADSYFRSIEKEWQKFVKDHKNKKLKDIFDKKGWKVK